jgi:hypothetical protein
MCITDLSSLSLSLYRYMFAVKVSTNACLVNQFSDFGNAFSSFFLSLNVLFNLMLLMFSNFGFIFFFSFLLPFYVCIQFYMIRKYM